LRYFDNDDDSSGPTESLSHEQRLQASVVATMLRPATPLSVILVGAFGLLLIAVISTPIVTSIPLGEYKGVKFGVFGFCPSNGKCSPIGIGYDLSTSSSSSSSVSRERPFS
jgi:hypothetical protein